MTKPVKQIYSPKRGGMKQTGRTMAFTPTCPRVTGTATTIQSTKRATYCYSFLPATSTSIGIDNMEHIPNKLLIDGTGTDTSSSSMLILSSSTVPESPTFEAVAPDASILIGLGVVVILSIIASFVWANEVVPVSRTKLALSKRDGEVKQYLDELKEGAKVDIAIDGNDSTSEIKTMNDEMGEQLTTVAAATTTTTNTAKNDGRDFERWLFTDWLENNKSSGKPGRKKEPALPILKTAKWNSGDNPVVVTAALMMVGIVLASITERVL